MQGCWSPWCALIEKETLRAVGLAPSFSPPVRPSTCPPRTSLDLGVPFGQKVCVVHSLKERGHAPFDAHPERLFLVPGEVELVGPVVRVRPLREREYGVSSTHAPQRTRTGVCRTAVHRLTLGHMVFSKHSRKLLSNFPHASCSTSSRRFNCPSRNTSRRHLTDAAI